MPFSPLYSKIIANDKKQYYVQTVKTEAKTDINSEEIKKIINVSAFSTVTKVETFGKEIRTEGKVTYYICYEADGGGVKKKEIGQDFTGTITAAEDVRRAYVKSRVVKTEPDASGIKLSVSATIELVAEVRTGIFANALTGGDNLVLDVKDYSITRGYGVKKTVYPVEEEFERDYAVEEVLFHRADPVVTAVQCGVGTIIVDGEVKISAVVLRSGEKSDIIKDVENVAYRAEIECDEAMPSMSATAKAELKSFKTDISVDPESGKSRVVASAIIQLEGEAFSTETVSLAADAFSTEDVTEEEKDELCFNEDCDIRTGYAEAVLTIPAEGIDDGLTLKAIGGERAEIVTSDYADGKLSVSGAVTFTGYYTGEEGKIFTRKCETPFDCSFECALPDGAEREIFAECGVKEIVSADTVKAEFCFTIYPSVCKKLRYVKGITAVSAKKRSDKAISVYISEENETLWSLCKRLNMSPEQVVATNKDLQFPLTGKERIVIYRQK